jgi:hypothetical protein
MKQEAPSISSPEYFETIAPYAQCTGRKTKRRGIFGEPYAAPVRRFDMHTQNARRAIGVLSIRTQ